ncbi:unnamed protein product, partial [Rotaria sp. Silwood2]
MIKTWSRELLTHYELCRL